MVAEEVPLPGLKGPSDFEAGSSPLDECWAKSQGALDWRHLKACVRMSHYRFGGKTQLPGFESERESIVMAWQLFSSFEIPGSTAKPLLSVLQG